jgi:histidinol phosphatase-like PHP family hydrolase
VTRLHDNHNHLVANGDAASMLRAAAAAGIAGFAFTEHVFHLEEARAASPYLGSRWDAELEGPPTTLAQYLADVDAAAAAVPEVHVALGVELEHWPDDPGVAAAQGAFLASSDRWDVVLGSVHCLSGDHSIFDSDIPLSPREAWTDYLDRLEDAVASGRYDVVTHPVRLAVSRRDRPADVPARLDRLAELAAETDTALEVNGSDVRVHPDFVELLCGSIARAGAPVSLGSDAHYPNRVGSVRAGVDLLRAAGVRSAVAFERRRRRDVPLA